MGQCFSAKERSLDNESPRSAFTQPRHTRPQNQITFPSNTDRTRDIMVFVLGNLGSDPKNHCSIPREHGSIPWNHCSSPWNHGSLPGNNGPDPRNYGPGPRGYISIPRIYGPDPRGFSSLPRNYGPERMGYGSYLRNHGPDKRDQPFVDESGNLYGQSFEELHAQLKNSGTLFVDPFFKADQRSLTYSGTKELTSELGPIQWKRPHKISSKPVFYEEKSSRFDVIQVN